jgi:hypothetical protein
MKQLITKKIIIALAVITLSACNTAPHRITPIYASTIKQSTCGQLEKERARLERIVQSQRAQLETDANIDKGIVAGSVLFMPIALIALAATGNKELQQSYAKNLGTLEQIEEKLAECE